MTYTAIVMAVGNPLLRHKCELLEEDVLGSPCEQYLRLEPLVILHIFMQSHMHNKI